LQLLLSVSVRRSLSLSLVCPFFLCAFKVPYYAIRLRGSGPRSLLPAKRVMETSFFFSFWKKKKKKKTVVVVDLSKDEKKEQKEVDVIETRTQKSTSFQVFPATPHFISQMNK
jgi:hypothetical protein